MNQKNLMRIGLVAGVLVFIVASSLLVSALDERARMQRQEAELIALQQVQGEVQEVELEFEDGTEIYEVEILTEDNTEVEVEIDAYTQEVLAIEEEDEEDDDIPITGTALERATQAALDYLGEGRVVETEIEDEDSYYEVEVRLDNGDEVDVQLDENFNVIDVEYD